MSRRPAARARRSASAKATSHASSSSLIGPVRWLTWLRVGHIVHANPWHRQLISRILASLTLYTDYSFPGVRFGSGCKNVVTNSSLDDSLSQGQGPIKGVDQRTLSTETSSNDSH